MDRFTTCAKIITDTYKNISKFIMLKFITYIKGFSQMNQTDRVSTLSHK